MLTVMYTDCHKLAHFAEIIHYIRAQYWDITNRYQIIEIDKRPIMQPGDI